MWLLLNIIFLSPMSIYAASQDPSVVILYGDSITVGYNLGENFVENFGNGRTINQLAGSRPLRETDAVLNESRPAHPSIVVNWGVGGTTSANGVSRISASIDATKNLYPADNYYVLIQFGTNDIGSGLSSSTTAFNIRQMINQVKAKGVNFVPIVGDLLPRSDRAVEPANSKIIPEVLSDGTSLVRLYEAFVNYPGGYTQLLGLETSVITGQQIRLHPNVTGYQVIAQTWFEQALQDLVPKQKVVISGPLLLMLSD